MTNIENHNVLTDLELNDRELDCVTGGTGLFNQSGDSGTLLKYAIFYGAEKGIETAAGGNAVHSN